MKSVFKYSNTLLNMRITFLLCTTNIKHLMGLVFHIRSQPVKHRYKNSQASKLMSMYHTHILHKMAFIFTHCKHTLFAVASLHRATLWGKITVLCKKRKSYMKSVKGTLHHLTHVLIASHTNSQSGQWAWVNHDPSFTQTCIHTHAKWHMIKTWSQYMKQVS
jgi:hypothetical protein